MTSSSLKAPKEQGSFFHCIGAALSGCLVWCWVRSPIISAECGGVGTECFRCPASTCASLQGPRGVLLQWGGAGPTPLLCPCPPEHPPTPTPCALLPCPACCCYQQSQGFPVALFQSTMAPKGLSWWQNPPIRPHSSLPKTLGLRHSPESEVLRRVQNGAYSLLGVPSPLTQGGSSSTAFSGATATTASLAGVYGGTGWLRAASPASLQGTSDAGDAKSQEPGAPTPLLWPASSLWWSSAHTYKAIVVVTAGGREGRISPHAARSVSLLLGSYLSLLRILQWLPIASHINLNLLSVGLQVLHNYIPPSHNPTPTHTSRITRGQTETVDAIHPIHPQRLLPGSCHRCLKSPPREPLLSLL